jgi:hypothetical protein
MHLFYIIQVKIVFIIKQKKETMNHSWGIVPKIQILLLVSILLCLSSVTFGQKHFVKGTLGMKDGTSLECEFVLKIHNGSENIFDDSHKYIYYKKAGSNEVLKMEQKKMSFISTTAGGNKILLKNLPYYSFTLKWKYKKNNDPVWMQLRGGCKDLESYLIIQGFEIDKNGVFWDRYLDGMGSFALLKPGEDAPHLVSYVFLKKQAFHKAWAKQSAKMLKVYFENDTDGLKFLEGKKRVPIEELVEYIDKRCKK